MTASGADYVQINSTGYVPVLQLDDDSLLSEGAVIDLGCFHGIVPDVFDKAVGQSRRL
jgi:hypothetical protein